MFVSALKLQKWLYIFIYQVVFVHILENLTQKELI